MPLVVKQKMRFIVPHPTPNLTRGTYQKYIDNFRQVFTNPAYGLDEENILDWTVSTISFYPLGENPDDMVRPGLFGPCYLPNGTLPIPLSCARHAAKPTGMNLHMTPETYNIFRAAVISSDKAYRLNALNFEANENFATREISPAVTPAHIRQFRYHFPGVVPPWIYATVMGVDLPNVIPVYPNHLGEFTLKMRLK